MVPSFHVGVAGSGLQGKLLAGIVVVAENHADIDILFQQMGGKAVTQRMGRHPLPDLGGFGCLMGRAVDLPG